MIDNSTIIRFTIKEIGSQAYFCSLLKKQALSITPCGLSQWIKKGIIPHRYVYGIRAILEAYRGKLTYPNEFYRCIQKPYEKQKQPSVHLHKNEVLNRTIGYIPEYLKIVNEGVDPREHISYQTVKGWLLTGYIPDHYKIVFRAYPKECFRPAQTPTPTPEELLE